MDGAAPGSVSRSPRLPTMAGFGALVWSHVVIIFVASVLGAAVGVLLERNAQRTFAASASIELQDVPSWVDIHLDEFTPQRTTIDSTAQLVFARPVVDRVAAVTGLTEQRSDDGLSVSAYPLSRVLIVTFQAPSSDLAVAGANEAARALIDERSNVLQGGHLRTATSLSKKLNRLKGKADAVVGPFNPISRQLQAQIAQIAQVRQESSSQGARVVDDAAVAHQVDNHTELTTTTGAMLGLLGGLAYAWWHPSRAKLDVS